MTIRSFIAIPIERDIANEIGDVAAKMSYQDKSNAVRWVDQENYHITLAFLGDQEQASLETLAEQLDYHLQETQCLVALTHPRPFPDARPKLLACMVDKTDEISRLHQQVHSAINSTGLSVDKRKFIPHVTLGRYRHSKNNFVGNIPLNLSLESLLEEVVLYESVLTPNGAEYEPIYRFPLDEMFFDE